LCVQISQVKEGFDMAGIEVKNLLVLCHRFLEYIMPVV